MNPQSNRRILVAKRGLYRNAQRMMPSFPLTSLPPELIMKIFSYVMKPKDKVRLERVSRYIRILVRAKPSWDGYHKLKLDYIHGKTKFDEFSAIMNRATIKEVYFNGLSESEFGYKALQIINSKPSKLSNVEKLIAHPALDQYLDNETMVSIIDQVSNSLKTFHYHGYAYDNFIDEEDFMENLVVKQTIQQIAFCPKLIECVIEHVTEPIYSSIVTALMGKAIGKLTLGDSSYITPFDLESEFHYLCESVIIPGSLKNISLSLSQKQCRPTIDLNKFLDCNSSKCLSNLDRLSILDNEDSSVPQSSWADPLIKLPRLSHFSVTCRYSNTSRSNGFMHNVFAFSKNMVNGFFERHCECQIYLVYKNFWRTDFIEVIRQVLAQNQQDITWKGIRMESHWNNDEERVTYCVQKGMASVTINVSEIHPLHLVRFTLVVCLIYVYQGQLQCCFC